MFTREKPKHQLLVEDELVHVLKTMRNHPTGSDEYVKTLTCVERLHGLVERTPSVVSKETWVTVGAHLVGILMILRHEDVGNVITSKALSFIPRLK
jgi:hypothetical protein